MELWPKYQNYDSNGSFSNIVSPIIKVVFRGRVRGFDPLPPNVCPIRKKVKKMNINKFLMRFYCFFSVDPYPRTADFIGESLNFVCDVNGFTVIWPLHLRLILAEKDFNLSIQSNLLLSLYEKYILVII